MSSVRITERDTLDVVVVEVHGDLGPAAAQQLREALVRAIRHSGSARVVLDLERAHAIAAEGLGAIVAGVDVATDSGVLFHVRGARPTAAEALRDAGLAPGRLAPELT
ncbi:MAG TPA: STAS domain-containing protein [Asanoa sp.]